MYSGAGAKLFDFLQPSAATFTVEPLIAMIDTKKPHSSLDSYKITTRLLRRCHSRHSFYFASIRGVCETVSCTHVYTHNRNGDLDFGRNRGEPTDIQHH